MFMATCQKSGRPKNLLGYVRKNLAHTKICADKNLAKIFDALTIN